MNIQRLDPAQFYIAIETVEGLADLFGHRAWATDIYPYRPFTQKDWWVIEGSDQISTEQMISFVCSDGKNVLGHAALINHGTFWECGRWAVDPTVQGQGIGQSLVSACVDYARKSRIPWFVVGCSYYQSHSEKICRSLGMTLLGVNPDIYRTPNASWGEVLFLWRNGRQPFPKELTNDQISAGIVGVWPNESGKWQKIETTNLPPFEIERGASRIEGRVSIHTTRATRDTFLSLKGT